MASPSPGQQDDALEALAVVLPALLLTRLRRLAAQWNTDSRQMLERVLERGLFECEAELRARFTTSDLEAWRAAIHALEAQPDDGGFAAIGRIDGSTTTADAEPSADE